MVSESRSFDHRLCVSRSSLDRYGKRLPLSNKAPRAAYHALYPAFPTSDQQLFTKAILQACDGLDGTVDGVIDNLPACQATFDPAKYTFTDTNQPLQCTGPKLATCLSPGQIDAVKRINQGPRTSLGQV